MKIGTKQKYASLKGPGMSMPLVDISIALLDRFCYRFSPFVSLDLIQDLWLRIRGEICAQNQRNSLSVSPLLLFRSMKLMKTEIGK